MTSKANPNPATKAAVKSTAAKPAAPKPPAAPVPAPTAAAKAPPPEAVAADLPPGPPSGPAPLTSWDAIAKVLASKRREFIARGAPRLFSEDAGT